MISQVAAPRADSVEVSVKVDEPTYDGYQALLDGEARDALAAGHYQRAWQMFWRLTEIDPNDYKALRECGRIANAMGRFEYAADALGRVDFLDGHAADPELHYLRGQSLYALGKKAEAGAEFGRMKEDLGPPPWDRRATLWLARVAVVEGDLDGALHLYEPLRLAERSTTTATYAETVLYEVEAYIEFKRWHTAETMLRDFLHEQPHHERALALLAWVLEGEKDTGRELTLRARLAEDWTDHPAKTLEYARALERAHQDGDALERYREAVQLGLRDGEDGVARLEYRITPELGAGARMRGDPSGLILDGEAGATVAIGRRTRIAVTATHEMPSTAAGVPETPLSFASAWLVRATRAGGALALGTTVGNDATGATHVGGDALVRSSPDRPVRFELRAGYRLPWDESASTLRQGGTVDVITGQTYVLPTPRLLLQMGVQGRRLGLAPQDGMDAPVADQLLVIAGADYTLSANPAAELIGDSLDHEMLAARSMATSVVASFRHYEMSSGDPFPQRVKLVTRSSIDELSAAARKVSSGGRIGGELRAGAGYDWQRAMRLWRAGASLVVAAAASTRLTFDYDVASETTSGLSGRRHVGSVMLHVDL